MKRLLLVITFAVCFASESMAIGTEENHIAFSPLGPLTV
jgi:hypothetical protein